MKEEIQELTEILKKISPESWDRIPDIDLYMDQVISYMEKQHVGFSVDSDESITPAMINNYIKSGVIERTKGKKYTKEHIAQLTVLCLLKQILPISDAGVLLKNELLSCDTEKFYTSYIGEMKKQADNVVTAIENREDESIIDMALQFAILSYIYRLMCKKLVVKVKNSNELGSDLLSDSDKKKKEK